MRVIISGLLLVLVVGCTGQQPVSEPPPVSTPSTSSAAPTSNPMVDAPRRMLAATIPENGPASVRVGAASGTDHAKFPVSEVRGGELAPDPGYFLALNRHWESEGPWAHDTVHLR
jgi:hypothetical protein